MATYAVRFFLLISVFAGADALAARPVATVPPPPSAHYCGFVGENTGLETNERACDEGGTWLCKAHCQNSCEPGLPGSNFTAGLHRGLTLGEALVECASHCQSAAVNCANQVPGYSDVMCSLEVIGSNWDCPNVSGSSGTRGECPPEGCDAE